MITTRLDDKYVQAQLARAYAKLLGNKWENGTASRLEVETFWTWQDLICIERDIEVMSRGDKHDVRAVEKMMKDASDLELKLTEMVVYCLLAMRDDEW